MNKLCLLISAAFCFTPLSAYSGEAYSPSVTGMIGLNLMPSARFEEKGRLHAGVSTSDPYWHGFLGFQLSDSLYVGLRQSAQVSNPLDNPDRFYPGIDTKIKVLTESAQRPAVALGLQSASGHAQMGGEYIVLSKRYKDFDFTAGAGWGRFGSAFHTDNPLKGAFSHFGRERHLNSELPVQPENWFTGEDIGFFGGLEYFTPLQGLSLKFDVGADRYEAEQAAFAFSAPAAWSLGGNYQMDLSPDVQANASLALQGFNRIMARLSLSSLLEAWPKRAVKRSAVPLFAQRHDRAFDVRKLEDQAERDQIALTGSAQSAGVIRADLSLSPHRSTPAQIGRAAVHMANQASAETETLAIRPSFLGLQGPVLSMQRASLENALARNHGSAEEIWRHTEISDGPYRGLYKRERRKNVQRGFMPFSLTLQHDLSLSDEDYGALHRTAFIAKGLMPNKTGYLDYGGALRVNLNDNYHHIKGLRPAAALPVRSDVAAFADQRFAVDEAYTLFTHSLRPNLHLSLMSGFLEEMYAGTGGEILYRPASSRFALGAEGFLALKRDPDTLLNLGLNGDRVLSGFINGWYDDPDHELIWEGKIGRFLNEDFGAQIGFRKPFKNGASLSGFITLSDTSDYDLFGGTTHANHGLRLSLPLGGIKPLPDYAKIDMNFAPAGRDIGQALHKPLDLYEATEGFSLGHLERYWEEITPPNTSAENE